MNGEQPQRMGGEAASTSLLRGYLTGKAIYGPARLLRHR